MKFDLVKKVSLFLLVWLFFPFMQKKVSDFGWPSLKFHNCHYLTCSPAVAAEVFVDCKGSSSPVCNPTSTPARPNLARDDGRSKTLEGANPDFYWIFLFILNMPVVNSRSSFEGADFALKKWGSVDPPTLWIPTVLPSAVQCRAGAV